MTQEELYNIKAQNIQKSSKYKMIKFDLWDYSILKYICNKRRSGRGTHESYNDCIIMADTETSKKNNDAVYQNHVVAWTISIRAYHMNIVTLYGTRPSELVECFQAIQESMTGETTIIYFHNLSYDWVFLRKFILAEYGTPDKQLNVKSHYPIYIMWTGRGLVLKDSLILAQRSLDKWGKDMNVEHQKAKGKWDYDLIRHQGGTFTSDELEYIEHDTLCGVECIDALKTALNKYIYSIPYTATGIPREEVRKRGKSHNARNLFKKQALTYEQYLKIQHVFHGGFTHANRHFINTVMRLVEDGLIQAYDFASSYPYVLLAFKYPMEAFTPLDYTLKISDIVDDKDNTAYMFKFAAFNIRLKNDDVSMPVLQFSKCLHTINAIQDNGRILCAGYVEIYINEMDAAIILDQYEWDKHVCDEIEFASKRYLPRWLTDYIFELFTDKCKLKNGDKVLYALAKAKLNSVYGMMVQKSIKDTITEDYITGEYIEEENDGAELYQKYIENNNSILCYQWGVWVTSYAQYNLFQLGKCLNDNGIWLYSDTDSCYGIGWNVDKVKIYNQSCKDRLIANGYSAVNVDGREFWLGVAEHKDKEDDYTEFVTQGAKRYCGRCVDDNELHITVAGVPKRGAKCLNDNISNFQPGMIFSGESTGKKTHTYFFIDDVYTDDNGNETGDSIDLSPCDYLLSSVYEVDWEKLFEEEISIQILEEEE